jgi:serine/threonine protein kinase
LITEQGYIHRDLKTENFFLSENYEVKLGDFGESCRQQTVESLNGRRMTILGTLSDIAPASIQAGNCSPTALDIYALGITFWEIVTGQDAHENKYAILWAPLCLLVNLIRVVSDLSLIFTRLWAKDNGQIWIESVDITPWNSAVASAMLGARYSYLQFVHACATRE